MLLNFNVTNFASFRDGFAFNMKPGKVMKRFSDNVINIGEKHVALKAAVIVGENAGGKTNFVHSIDFLKYLFSIEYKSIHMLKSLSFANKSSSKQSYELTVLVDNVIYIYKLEIDINSIVNESLQIRRVGQSTNTVVFKLNRTSINIKKDEHNSKTQEIKYSVKANEHYINPQISKEIELKSGNTLFVNLLSLVNVDIVVPFVNWIKNDLIIMSPGNVSLNIYQQMEKSDEDIVIMRDQRFFDIFSLVDPSIEKIVIDEKQPYEKTLIYRKIESDKNLIMSLFQESSGIQEYFAWCVYIWKVLYQNKTVIADEMDRSLNVVLSDKIINYIQNTEHSGQFIFTTHDIFHLNTKNYMKEQLYIVSKGQDCLSSKMYSLADFKEYRYSKPDVYNLYLKGILGGVPQ